VTDFSRELLDRLRQAGYEFVRHGKGSHDIWRDPATGKAVAIPHKIPSRTSFCGMPDCPRRSERRWFHTGRLISAAR